MLRISAGNWFSDGRQLLHFKPLLDARWSQVLEVTLGELDRSEAESVPETKE